MTNEEIQKSWQDALDKWCEEYFWFPFFEDLVNAVPNERPS